MFSEKVNRVPLFSVPCIVNTQKLLAECNCMNSPAKAVHKTWSWLQALRKSAWVVRMVTFGQMGREFMSTCRGRHLHNI